MANTKIPSELVDDQVFGRRNLIINGDMQVAQRGTSTTGIGASSGYFACDRWKLVTNGISGRLTQTQSTDTPNDFGSSTKLECTTADTSIGASDYFLLQQTLEGQDLQRFAKGTSSAKKFTLSFYVKGNAAATYTYELFDNENNRQISKTFAVTTSWNRIELTFPADTSGAFSNDNSGRLALKLWLQAGSNRTSGTLNSSAWASNTDANRVSSSQTNFFDSTSRTLFITGVQFEVGDQATPFEYRSIAEELALCQRYFTNIGYNTSWFIDAYLSSAAYSTDIITFPTEMRTTPSNSPAIDKSDFTLSNVTTDEFRVNLLSQNAFIFQVRASSTGRTYALANTTGNLSFDAEL